MKKQYLCDFKSNSYQSAMKKLFKKKTRYSTSLSDNQTYPDACLKASTDMKTFNNFRRNRDYRRILEHVDKEKGELYLKEINKNSKILDHIEKFRENDNWGHPFIYDYPGIGIINPSTIRYIKVLSDLELLFGSLDNMNICEIGVGYGGQCRIINSIYKPSHYTLVDIKPALMLTQRYLDNYILNSVVDYKTMNELEIKSYDLVISNYAFTELPRSIQDVYLRKIILNTKKGYITYNQINPDYFSSYNEKELSGMFEDSVIMEEKPLTKKNNCIIAWGHKNTLPE